MENDKDRKRLPMLLVKLFELLTLKLGAEILLFLLGSDFPLRVIHRAGSGIGGLAHAGAHLAIGLTFHTAIHKKFLRAR